jgi:hypothetical protein
VTVPPLKGPHIQATGYRRGRARAHTANPPTWLALHTTEGITDEIALGRFWQGRAASSHAGIGRDGGYASYVRYDDTAWTNPPVHDDTETVEICAMAGWNRAQWLAFPKMLETLAHWLAWRGEVRHIPIIRREGNAIATWKRGVVDHDGINDVFHASDHWDVGESFPWDKVLGRAIAIQNFYSTPQPPPAQEDDDMATLLISGTRRRVVFGDQIFALTEGDYNNFAVHHDPTAISGTLLEELDARLVPEGVTITDPPA